MNLYIKRINHGESIMLAHRKLWNNGIIYGDSKSIPWPRITDLIDPNMKIFMEMKKDFEHPQREFTDDYKYLEIAGMWQMFWALMLGSEMESRPVTNKNLVATFFEYIEV